MDLLELFESERKEWSEHVLNVAADRFERRLTEELSRLRLEFRQALNDLATSLRLEMATTRVELLKWSFVFWVGQVAVMAGLLSLMLRR